MEAAKLKADVAFEMFTLLGVPFYCFHDADVRPAGGSFSEDTANLKLMVDYLAEPSAMKNECVNIVPGWVEPSDMREIKRICWQMGVDVIMFPDTSDVLDAPQTAGEYSVNWDGRNSTGTAVASGTYIYRMTAGDQVISRQMLLTK